MKALSRLVPALFIVGTVTVISAQPETPAPAPAAKATLSASEMAARGKAMQVQIADDYRHVLSLKDRTKKQQDVVKLNCVNDKLVQVKAQMNIAQKADESLTRAIERNGDERVGIFAEVTATSDNVKQLREEANGCLGEPELFKQESGVEVHRPEITDDPNDVDPYDPGLVEVDSPGYASAFQ